MRPIKTTSLAVFDIQALTPSAKQSIQLSVEGGALLRPLREHEVTVDYVNGLNDPRVAQHLVGPRRQRQSLETVRDYVRRNWADARALLLGIYIDGALRGTVRLYDIDDSGQAVMGIALFDADYRGRGWGSRCIRRVAEFAIRDLGLRRIVAASYRRNAGAIRAFAAAGFARTPERDFADEHDHWISCAFPERD